jgi:hypothetical protein
MPIVVWLQICLEKLLRDKRKREEEIEEKIEIDRYIVCQGL